MQTRPSSRTLSAPVTMLLAQRLCKLNRVPVLVIDTEIPISPWLAHDLLSDKSAALLQFGKQALKVLREDVNSYRRKMPSVVLKQVNRNIVPFHNRITPIGQLQRKPKSKLLLVVLDRPLQI